MLLLCLSKRLTDFKWSCCHHSLSFGELPRSVKRDRCGDLSPDGSPTVRRVWWDTCMVMLAISRTLLELLYLRNAKHQVSARLAMHCFNNVNLKKKMVFGPRSHTAHTEETPVWSLGLLSVHHPKGPLSSI